MNEEILLSTFRWHAGLELSPEGAVSSLTACLSDLNVPSVNLDDAVNDVIKSLQQLNWKMNGKIPSESAEKEKYFTRRLVYAISEILRILRASVDNAKNDLDRLYLSDRAWRLETAWSAVLAGDIDDLKQHIAEESMVHCRSRNGG